MHANDLGVKPSSLMLTIIEDNDSCGGYGSIRQATNAREYNHGGNEPHA